MQYAWKMILHIRLVITNMREYFCEDVLEGASLLLPGNVVYIFHKGYGQVFDYTIDLMEISGSKEKGFTVYYKASHEVDSECEIDYLGFYIQDIGKTVFISREDCEWRSN